MPTLNDRQLAAVLIHLEFELAPIIDKLIAGKLDQDSRVEYAKVFATIAAGFNPDLLQAAIEEGVRNDDGTDCRPERSSPTERHGA